MKYIVFLATFGVVTWLLSKLMKAPRSSADQKKDVLRTLPIPSRTKLGRGLDALIPTTGQHNQNNDAPLPPPNWVEGDLEFLQERIGMEEVFMLPKPKQGEMEIWACVEDAFITLMAVNLFKEYKNRDQLSLMIRERLESYDRMIGREYWHSTQVVPLEKQHPWSDIFMLLAFGPEAGFALHNAFTDGLTTEALIDFVDACKGLCKSELETGLLTWEEIKNEGYCLRFNEMTFTYPMDQSLWTVPLQVVFLLNELLPNTGKNFEAVTLLPIYGETLVFYLNKGQKRLLAHERGWNFFDWNQLQGRAA